ncbi:hypothetical protein HYH03_004072 [Edaphochlamys debaryana]|uniref:Uncharacterized protein n=1 Tax=Edaphochlamys debaryana TaxID=47281 RepID=A0A836C2A3_9CHLO|nr:hypothetical protein HYH03_004072 [Edaphochlamys debaryana]|eukprot:KAG2497801.1 hypothetical protein HYH03_004072 [Edaphochlamys debaryana]
MAPPREPPGSGGADAGVDLAVARCNVAEAAAQMHALGVLPGDPGSAQQGHLAYEAPLEAAAATGQRLKAAAELGAERERTKGGQDLAPAPPPGDEEHRGHEHGREGGLLAAAAHAVTSVVGNFSESLREGIESATRERPEPPTEREQAGHDRVRVKDMLGGSESDTPYPGDMVDEPVQLEGGQPKGSDEGVDQGAKPDVIIPQAEGAFDESRPGRLDPSPVVTGGLPGGPTPHVQPPEARMKDPGTYMPLEGGPATTVRDSGVMINLGPTGPEAGARHQGFGTQSVAGGLIGGSGGEGLVGGLMGALKDGIAAATGRHTVDSSLSGFNMGAVETRPHDQEERERLAELKSHMEGMPGSMPIDREIRELRESEAEQRIAALAAQREAVSSAARDVIAERHPEVADKMGIAHTHQHRIADGHGWEDQAAEREGRDAGGGGGLLSGLAATLGSVLGLGGGREERHQERGSEPADVPRRPVPIGTSPLEARPDNLADVGAPPAAEANAQRTSSALNAKEGGRQVPAGALGSTATDPSQTTQSYAPDFNKPNFFAEVEKRGLGDVLASGAASMGQALDKSMEELKHGGAPAPGSTTMGSVADPRDITRNTERAEHLDDPVQRRIYEAEVVKVAPGKNTEADLTSHAEAVKEATSAMVLGKDRQITGTVPHGQPPGPHPARPIKQDAGQSLYGSFGTGGNASN